MDTDTRPVPLIDFAVAADCGETLGRILNSPDADDVHMFVHEHHPPILD